MASRKLRRIQPNLMAEAKVFTDHHHLMWARSYDEYEAGKQEYRETGLFNDFDPVQNLVQFWPLVSCLIELPDEPEEPEFRQLAFSDKICVLTEQLEEIENFYLVMRRSIDFQTTTSKKIDVLLAKPRKGEVDRNLLTPDQQVQFRSLVSDADMWSLKSSNKPSSLAEIYLAIQDEIDVHGAVQAKGRSQLLNLKALRAGTKRPRLYAEAALVMMLAEFFEDKNEFGFKSVMKRDAYQPPKDSFEYSPDEDKERDEDAKTKEWTPNYVSPFSRFIADFQDVFQIERIGLANAEKITKNRKKLKSNKVLHHCGLFNADLDFSTLFQVLDKVKP